MFLTRQGTRLVGAIRKHVERFELEILGRVTEADLLHAAETLLEIKHTLLSMLGEDPELSGEKDGAG